MKVKDVQLKVGDKVRQWTRTTYQVISIKPFQGCPICEGCDGMTVVMHVQRVLKNGNLVGETMPVFGDEIFSFQVVV